MKLSQLIFRLTAILIFLLFSDNKELFANNIFNAILGANFNDVKAILERHPEFVNARDQNKNTPLHVAAELGMVDVATLLISKGACITAKNADAMTPLHYAVQGFYDKKRKRNSNEIARLLILKGVDYDTMNKRRKTPMIYAAEYGNEEMVELLLSKGVDVNEKGDCGNTPLHFASLDRWPDEMTDRKELKKKYWNTQLCLISHGANVNAKNDWGDTPLHYAVEGSDVSFEYVKLLISKGADVNARNINGNTPLNLAKFGGNKDIIDLLRQHGARE